jgi:hypothetical protein
VVAPSVFIRYRRVPPTLHVPFLRRLLVDRLGERRVFRDVDSTPTGDDWPDAIAAADCAFVGAFRLREDFSALCWGRDLSGESHPPHPPSE